MFNDILFSGARRYMVTTVDQQTGRLAEVGVVFYLDELKEVSEQTQDRVKYIGQHSVIGRVKLLNVLNPVPTPASRPRPAPLPVPASNQWRRGKQSCGAREIACRSCPTAHERRAVDAPPAGGGRDARVVSARRGRAFGG